MMKCLKCGYERKPGDGIDVPATECPSCGVVYVKAGARLTTNPWGAPFPLSGRPSALDESSLRQARQRVEMRLRQKSLARQRDERYALTLQRARQIAAAAAQKRRAEMLARQPSEIATDDEAPAAAAPGATAALEAVSEPYLQDAPGKEAEAQQPEPRESSAPSQARNASPPAPQALAATPPAAHKAAMPQPAVLPDSAARLGQDPSSDADGSGSAGKRSRRTHSTRRARAQSGRAATAGFDAVPFDPHAKTPGGGMMRLLPLVAWLILSAGVIGMILSWTTLTAVEAGVHAASPNGLEALPLGLLLGFAYLATGVLGFAFFWVSSLISRQLRDIRRLLILQMPARARGNHGCKG